MVSGNVNLKGTVTVHDKLVKVVGRHAVYYTNCQHLYTARTMGVRHCVARVCQRQQRLLLMI